MKCVKGRRNRALVNWLRRKIFLLWLCLSAIEGPCMNWQFESIASVSAIYRISTGTGWQREQGEQYN